MIFRSHCFSKALNHGRPILPIFGFPLRGRVNGLGWRRKLGYSFSMTGIETEVLESLLELEEAIKFMATANPKPSLLPLFSRIDELIRKLPTSTDPALLHYLHKKSYEKARLFLQGRDAENTTGSCGHLS